MFKDLIGVPVPLVKFASLAARLRHAYSKGWVDKMAALG